MSCRQASSSSSICSIGQTFLFGKIDDLEWGVGIVACIRIFNGILDLFEYPFDGLIHIVGCLEVGVVLDEIGGGNVGARRVHMR